MTRLSVQDLLAMRDWVGRRSTLMRGGFILAAATLLYSYGSEGLSYLTTAGRLVKDQVRVTVPIEFELERARTMVIGLVPEVRQNMIVIAQEEVGVEHLRKELARAESDLAKQKGQIITLRQDVENKTGVLKKGLRNATSEEVRDELARRFSRYQTAEATVAAKVQLLEAREKSLLAARSKVDNMLNVKKDLELQIEQLESRLKTQQSQSVTSEVAFDDSRVSKCRQLVDDLRIRLEVADRLLASQVGVTDLSEPTITASGDITEQIDNYFTETPKNPEVAKAH